ncbi:MAG TPA: GDP-mannose 4,6-dehydratase [Solirubrobacteraceae bacterium]|nr:GDP-mannose 4,6-dehydratase [Solirubrobacteraceae bacterium]
MAGRPSLITGITGQDGSFLAEQLLAEGREVAGLVRRAHEPELPLAPQLAGRVALVTADLRDEEGLRRAIAEVAPEEVFHLAAPAFVPDSWRRPSETMTAIAVATGVVIEAAREVDARVVVAGSSQVFAGSGSTPQREDTPPRPTNPYAAAKLAAHELVRVLRGDGAFASTLILYNHESPRRPERYVTRKLTRAAAAVSLGLEDRVLVGDLDAQRDWLHAEDVVRAMVLAARHDEPDDYIVASGVARTVREFARAAFAVVGLDADEHLEVDPALVRGPESTVLAGDAAKAHATLGWQPRIPFDALVREMVEADLERLRRT